MAPATRNRRPLPRRVYWFRRLLVLGVVGGVAAALVLGIGRLLDYSGAASGGGEQAAPVASSPRPSDVEESSTAPRPEKRDRSRKGEDRDRLARPDGPCEDSDVLVTPTIGEAHAGSPVEIVLEVTTVEADACYWEVSAETVFVNVEGPDGTLWSSQDCPGAVPTESVVPRRERPAEVAVWWNGKESDEGCPAWTEWVGEGTYTAVAAARGSVTPVATGFLLGPPVAPTVTTTPTPSSTPSTTPSTTPSPTRTSPSKSRPGRGQT